MSDLVSPILPLVGYDTYVTIYADAFAKGMVFVLILVFLWWLLGSLRELLLLRAARKRIQALPLDDVPFYLRLVREIEHADPSLSRARAENIAAQAYTANQILDN